MYHLASTDHLLLETDGNLFQLSSTLISEPDEPAEFDRDWTLIANLRRLDGEEPEVDDELQDELEIVMSEWRDYRAEARRHYYSVPCYTGAL